MEANRHHILHESPLWLAEQNNKKLRRSIGMIALMDVEVHDALHAACPAVPVLDRYTAQRTARLYVPHTNPIMAIDNLRFAIDQAIRHPRTHDIERQSAMLTIEAVTLQLPFLREGIVTDTIDNLH